MLKGVFKGIGGLGIAHVELAAWSIMPVHLADLEIAQQTDDKLMPINIFLKVDQSGGS